MHSIVLRGGLVAAATILALGHGLVPAVNAQQVSTAEAEADARVVAAKGAWSAAKTYATDDLVTSRGSTWRAKRANTNKLPGSTIPSTAKDWELFAAGLNPVGAWLGSSTYQRNDLVTHQGATWRALRTIVGKTPVAGAGWELVAAKGETGEVGAAGPTGPTGATGAIGPAGPNTGIAAGTQSAPAFSFTGYPGTGIFSPSTGTAAGSIALVQYGFKFLHNDVGWGNLALGHNALSVTPAGGGNTAIGASALSNNTGSRNTAVGASALIGNTNGYGNTGVGNSALQKNTSGYANTVMGDQAMYENTEGLGNVAVGQSAGMSVTTGDYNVMLGTGALTYNTTGSNNIAIGTQAGQYPGLNGGSPENSIFIGNYGISGDTNVIKIGNTQAKTFISGISGVTTDVADAVPVMVDSTGQLGVTSSSRRYKFDIDAMGDVSGMLAKLRPVTFRYNKAQDGGAHPLQYGLIAEEVADVFPDLAVFNKDGAPETVKYHLLPSFLLAGYQEQQKMIAAQAQKIDAQADKIDALEQRLRGIEAMLPRVTTTAAVQ